MGTVNIYAVMFIHEATNYTGASENFYSIPSLVPFWSKPQFEIPLIVITSFSAHMHHVH